MKTKHKVTKILIVEDQPIAAMVAQKMVTDLGYIADIAESGEEALQKSLNNYDLIFMDIGLPDMDGIKVTSEIRRREKNEKHIPIVALTAYTDNKVQSSCLAIGMQEVLNKPATAEKLNEIILKYCSNSIS
jgi:two-component system aerobic respiration control sensor histidine kinase ArcB